MEHEQGPLPRRVLLDSGFADAEDIEALEVQGVEVVMPPRDEAKDRQAGRDPYARKRRDSDAVAVWRARMATAAALRRPKPSCSAS